MGDFLEEGFYWKFYKIMQGPRVGYFVTASISFHLRGYFSVRWNTETNSDTDNTIMRQHYSQLIFLRRFFTFLTGLQQILSDMSTGSSKGFEFAWR